jgi:RsiW-degrading membrane proteinase PrsW (M82 family)
MTTEGWTVLALVLLPVVAVISLGLLARAFVDSGGSHWPLSLVVLALLSGAWFYFFTTESP